MRLRDDRPFIALLVVRNIAIFGNAFGVIALAFGVLDAGWGAATLGFVVGGRSLASILATLVSGSIADRFGRVWTIRRACLVAGTSQLMTAAFYQAGAGRIPVALCAALSGAAAASVVPASVGLVPEIVPRAQLQAANSTMRFGLNVMVIAGSSIGGVVVAAAGPAGGLLVDGACLMAAAVASHWIRVNVGEQTQEEPDDCRPASIKSGVANGIYVVRAIPWLWRAILAFAVINLVFVSASTVLGPLQADARAGSGVWGWVLAAEGAGLAGGAIVARFIRPTRPLGCAVVFVALTVAPLASLSLSATFFLIGVCFFLSGAGVTVFSVLWETALQVSVPSDRLSSVVAIDSLGSLIVVPLGEVLSGPLSEMYSSVTVLSWMTCALAAACGYLLISRHIWAVRSSDSMSFP